AAQGRTDRKVVRLKAQDEFTLAGRHNDGGHGVIGAQNPAALSVYGCLPTRKEWDRDAKNALGSSSILYPVRLHSVRFEGGCCLLILTDRWQRLHEDGLPRRIKRRQTVDGFCVGCGSQEFFRKIRARQARRVVRQGAGFCIEYATHGQRIPKLRI